MTGIYLGVKANTRERVLLKGATFWCERGTCHQANVKGAICRCEMGVAHLGVKGVCANGKGYMSMAKVVEGVYVGVNKLDGDAKVLQC